MDAPLHKPIFVTSSIKVMEAKCLSSLVLMTESIIKNLLISIMNCFSSVKQRSKIAILREREAK